MRSGIRQKLMPIPGVTEVTVEGVRLSRAALELAERMYGAYSPWVGGSPATPRGGERRVQNDADSNRPDSRLINWEKTGAAPGG